MNSFFEKVRIRRVKAQKKLPSEHHLEVTLSQIQSSEVVLIIRDLLLQIEEVETCTVCKSHERTCKIILTVCKPIGCDAVSLISGALGPNIHKEIARLLVIDLTATINTK